MNNKLDCPVSYSANILQNPLRIYINPLLLPDIMDNVN